MADEITITAMLRFEKGSVDVDLSMIAEAFTVAGTDYRSGTQSVGTVEEELVLGDAGTGGYLLGINRDDTNFMQIQTDTGVDPLVRLEPGDVCLFRVEDESTPYVIADTAAVQFEYLLIEA